MLYRTFIYARPQWAIVLGCHKASDFRSVHFVGPTKQGSTVSLAYYNLHTCMPNHRSLLSWVGRQSFAGCCPTVIVSSSAPWVSWKPVPKNKQQMKFNYLLNHAQFMSTFETGTWIQRTRLYSAVRISAGVWAHKDLFTSTFFRHSL